jgi:hypothetical protein
MQLATGAGQENAWLDVRLDRLGAFQLPDQWVAVSGTGRLSWQAGTLGAQARLAVDAGYWQLARGGTRACPTMWWSNGRAWPSRRPRCARNSISTSAPTSAAISCSAASG